MDLKKTISENKVPILIGAGLIILGIFYFGRKSIRIGSKKEGDVSGEDLKGGLLIEPGKDYQDILVGVTKNPFNNENITIWLRMYRNKQFKFKYVKNGKTVDGKQRGKYENDGRILFFEDGKVIEGTSIMDIAGKLRPVVEFEAQMTA